MGFWLLLWGSIPGLGLGCLLGFAMAQNLGVGTADLVVIAIALLTIVGASVLVSAYLPTQRVLRIEPSEALRYE